MSNYYSMSRTNYFHVTDEDKYNEIFSRLGIGSCDSAELLDFTELDENGKKYHAFAGYGDVVYTDGKNTDEPLDPDNKDVLFEDFVKDIQQIMLDDEAIIITTIGYEKLKYLTGFAQIITKNRYEIINLENMAILIAGQYLGHDIRQKVNY